VPNPSKLYTDITLEAKHENSSEILAKKKERENPRKNSNHTRTNQEPEKEREREGGEIATKNRKQASKHVVTGGGVRAGRAPR
jgi:hypothetical protein